MAEVVAEKSQAQPQAQSSAQFKAKLKFARITPRKLRYVVDLIRGKSYNEAISILKVVPRRGSYFARKLLESAMANATHIIREKNLDVDVNQLYLTKAFVNEGPMMKRWTAAPQGRALMIKKRMSHVEFVLEEKKVKVKEEPKHEEAEPKEKQEAKPPVKAEETEKTEKKAATKRVTKRITRRTKRTKGKKEK